MPLLVGESKTALGHGVAKQVAGYLRDAYPGHTWFVRVDGGVIYVRCASVSGKVGMVLHIRDVDHDAKVMKQKTIRAAGELLERAHLRRGSFNGLAKVIEGAEKFRAAPTGLIIPESAIVGVKHGL